MRMLIAAVASVALLASCTTDEQRAAAARAYDKICTTEPPLYAAYINVATARGSSERTMRRAEAFHVTIMTMCSTRPTDPVIALVTLSAIYAQIVRINASVR